MLIIRDWLQTFWDWFWYFRRGKIRYRIFCDGETYIAMASDGKISVWNCYGTTALAAKEMAQSQLRAKKEEFKK